MNLSGSRVRRAYTPRALITAIIALVYAVHSFFGLFIFFPSSAQNAPPHYGYKVGGVSNVPAICLSTTLDCSYLSSGHTQVRV